MENVKYKGLELPKNLVKYFQYMYDIEEYREVLHDVSKSWDNLTLLGQLGNTGTDLGETKKNFSILSNSLLQNLSQEKLKNIALQMSSKAQVSVDIVIRNLFERTADIGFLATDEDIRKYIINKEYNEPEKVEKLRKRFQEYSAKYSVYYDIVLLKPNGKVIATLDPKNDLTVSKDQIIELCVNTNEDYIETYKYHDFKKDEAKTLVYSYRVTTTNDKDSEVIGVLALCFKFEDEMAGIYKNLTNKDNKECLTLLDSDGVVISSSDIYHVPIGAKVEMSLDEDVSKTTFGGRDYIVQTRKTHGYQGFFGLGWYGHVMIPIEYAFIKNSDHGIKVNDNVLYSIQHNEHLYSPELINIPFRAKQIQEELDRTVWNGNIKQNNNSDKRFSRALLNEIRATGENTKEIFQDSIIDLNQTIIGSVLDDVSFVAQLSIDIMDRNLYERANDCRWWALSEDFRVILDKDSITTEDKTQITNILKYINDLYTVYTNLFVYDKNGVVIAVSNSDTHLIGKKLPETWIDKCLQNSKSSVYNVSKFERTYLYGDDHTYIYNATITSLTSNKVVGGIGIVFDSKPQFNAMLKESLPNLGRDETMFSYFLTENKEIISSSLDDAPIGNTLIFDCTFSELQNGDTTSSIIEYKNKFYAVAVSKSKGYREYKSELDTYHNNVFSAVFYFIGEVHEMTKKVGVNKVQAVFSQPNSQNSIEVATFFIGQKWLGIKSTSVVEAIRIDDLNSSISLNSEHHFKGTAPYKNLIVSVLDIGGFIKENIQGLEYKYIVIMKYTGKTDEHFIGLLVHELGDIPEVDVSQISELSSSLISRGELIESIVRPISNKSGDQNKLLTLINISTLVSQYKE